jgi:hypothetical protein
LSSMIDTHRYYQKLREAGVEERQAEAMTQGLAEVVIGSVATKGDIAAEFGVLRAEIGGLRSHIDAENGRLWSEVANLEDNVKFVRNLVVGMSGLLALIVVLAQSVGVYFSLHAR